MAKEKTPMGRYIKETMNAGYLISDEKTLEIVQEYLGRDEYNKGYILDGFPRTVPQAEQFQNGITAAVYLRVTDKEALWRLAGRDDEGVREDNNLKAIMKRINLFHEKTEPVIEFYRNKGKIIDIDGEMQIEEINNKIMDELSKRS
jgi:adenylate kinase